MTNKLNAFYISCTALSLAALGPNAYADQTKSETLALPSQTIAEDCEILTQYTIVSQNKKEVELLGTQTAGTGEYDTACQKIRDANDNAALTSRMLIAALLNPNLSDSAGPLALNALKGNLGEVFKSEVEDGLKLYPELTQVIVENSGHNSLAEALGTKTITFDAKTDNRGRVSAVTLTLNPQP